jgi:hypothetical protein
MVGLGGPIRPGQAGSCRTGRWGLKPPEGRLRQLDPDGEKGLPGRGGRRERRAPGGVGGSAEVRRLLELAKGLLRAARVGRELAEEGVELLWKEPD